MPTLVSRTTGLVFLTLGGLLVVAGTSWALVSCGDRRCGATPGGGLGVATMIASGLTVALVAGVAMTARGERRRSRHARLGPGGVLQF